MLKMEGKNREKRMHQRQKKRVPLRGDIRGKRNSEEDGSGTDHTIYFAKNSSIMEILPQKAGKDDSWQLMTKNSMRD